MKVKDIYYVGGSKGGVGKSLVSLVLYDFLTRIRQVNVLSVDTDMENSNFATAVLNSHEARCDNVINTPLVSYDDQHQASMGGLVHIMQEIERSNCAAAIIDAPAGDGAFMLAAWPVLKGVAEQLGARLHVLPVTNAEDLSLLGLLSSGWIDILSEADNAVIILNEIVGTDFGTQQRHPEYVQAVRHAVEFRLPKLAPIVAASVRQRGKTFEHARETEPMVNRVLINSWLVKVNARFAEVNI